MFNFIRDAVAVFKIRGVMGTKANWISEVEIPNLEVGSILPVIITTFPSGDVRSIQCNRKDRTDVMVDFMKAGLEVVAADLEVLTIKDGKIGGFKLMPDYSTRTTIAKSPTAREYIRVNSTLSRLSEQCYIQFTSVGKLRNLSVGDRIQCLVIKHASGAVCTRVMTTHDLEHPPVLVSRDLEFLREAGYDAQPIVMTITEIRKGGRFQAGTHDSVGFN